MKPGMAIRQSQLEELLESNELTAGMYVRVHGDNLILGRREALGPTGEMDDDDRVKLTRLGNSTYGLSVKRHTGRWEKTPFRGLMNEMVDVIWTLMQHLVASWHDCTGTSGA
jgi:hypothetical protein